MIRGLLRHSGPILLGTLALTAFLAWRASRIRADFTVGRLYGTSSEEFARYDRFRQEFGSDDTLLYVAFAAPDAFAPETLRLLRDLGERIGRVEGVRRTWGLPDALGLYPFPFDARREVEASPLFRGTLFAEDRRAVCLWVTLRDDVDTAEERRIAIEGIRAALPGFHVSGAPVVEHEYAELTKRDLRTFMPIAGGIFLVLLAVYFRNLAGTLLPLLTVAMAIVWTLGAMELLGIPMGILTSLVPSLVLVLGIADAIHVLAHHREEITARPDDPGGALARGLRIMLPACFLTSFTTAVGFASLVTTPVAAIREFGLVTAGGILAAYVVTATFLPGALVRLPPFRARPWGAVGDRLLGGVAGLNERRPGLVAAVATVAVAVAVLGALRVRRESSWLHDLRPDHPVRQAHEFFERNLSGVFSVDLRIDAPLRDLATLRKVDEVQREIAGMAGVRHLVGFPDLVREVRPARPRALPATQEEYDAVLRALEARTRASGTGLRLSDAGLGSCRLSLRMQGMTSRSLDALARELELAAERHRAAGLEISITGKTWVAKRAMDRVIASMLSSLGLATLVIFGSMAVLFRSLRVGLLAILPNVLPMLFTAGLMGWAGIDLNFSTVTVFSISLGIAVDTTIHYLSRLRVELARDPDPTVAMHRAVRGAGGPMIFGTLLLVLGFGSILTSNFLFTFHFGLLGGFALIMALFCDLFVTPTLFRAFWKKRLDGR